METAKYICKIHHGEIFHLKHYEMFENLRETLVKSDCLTKWRLRYAFLKVEDKRKLQMTNMLSMTFKLFKQYDVNEHYPVICTKDLIRTTSLSYTSKDVTSHTIATNRSNHTSEMFGWFFLGLILICMVAGGIYLIIKKRRVSLIILYKEL